MQRFRSKPLILNQRGRFLLKGLLHLLLLGYVCGLFALATFDKLGADPVEALLEQTGVMTLWILFATLLIPLISQALPFPYLLQCRRLVGLYAFFYACCHLATFYLFELQTDLQLVWDEIVERPYITVGFSAMIILLMLAITSLHRIRRALGHRWQMLHKSIYVATFLGLLHFTWAQKTGWQEPVWYWVTAFLIATIRFYKPKWHTKRIQ